MGSPHSAQSHRLALGISAGMLGLFVVAACLGPAAGGSPAGAVPSRTLTVFAAASLTEPFAELGRQFEATHPGVRVQFNFAGTQQLRAQLEQGAHADVFAAASAKEMDAAIAASLAVNGTQRTFARNRLVVIVPSGNPGKVRSPADLGRPGLKLDLADPSVPVGQYSLAMLDKMSRDPAYGADFARKVESNVVSREDNVKSVVQKVSLGEVDAGVVYATDVGGAAARVGEVPVPDQYNQIAAYPIAPRARAPQPVLAQQFTEMVTSTVGQKVLAGHGFLPAGGE